MTTFRIYDTNNNSALTKFITYLIDEKSNAKIYGATGDGIIDDTNAILSAVNNSSSLYLPEGIYRISSSIDINKSNFCIIGDNATIVRDEIDANDYFFNIFSLDDVVLVTSASTLVEGSREIILDDATGVQPGDWCYITSTQNWIWSSSWTTRMNICEIQQVDGNTVLLTSPLLVPITENITITIYRPIENILITGITFVLTGVTKDVPAFNTDRCALRSFNVKNLTVQNCVFQNITSYGILFFYTLYTAVVNCTFYGSPNNDASTTEYNGLGAESCHDCHVIKCTFFDNTYPITSAYTSRHIISNCSSISARVRFIFFREGNVYCTVINNWGYSQSAGFIVNNGAPITLMANNMIQTTGNSLAYAFIADNFSNTNPLEAADSLSYPSNIVNNVFETSRSIGGNSTMSMGNYYSSLLITNNNIIGRNSALLCRSQVINRLVISDNVLTCTNVTSTADAIRFDTSNNNLTVRKNIIISNNIIRGYSRNGIVPSGSTKASYNTNFMSIRNNIIDATLSTTSPAIISTAINYYGGSIHNRDNIVVGTDAQQYTFVGSRFFESAMNREMVLNGLSKNINAPNIIGYSNNTTLPDKSTVERSCIIMNTEHTKSSSLGWICVQGGTEGTLSGVTATNLGGLTITVVGNTTDGIYRGCFITVNGISSRVTSVSIDLSVITLVTSVGTGSGTFPVVYTAPVFVPLAPIVEIITGAYGINTGSTNLRTNTTSVNSINLTQTASKLTNLITDLLASGLLPSA